MEKHLKPGSDSALSGGTYFFTFIRTFWKQFICWNSKHVCGQTAFFSKLFNRLKNKKLNSQTIFEILFTIIILVLRYTLVSHSVTGTTEKAIPIILR